MMMSSMDDARRETLARMAQSRAQIRQLLDPPSPAADSEGDEAGGAGAAADRTFPRSRTMRALLSGRGIGTAGAVLTGLLVARPALLVRALRLIPTGAVARLLLVKGISWIKARR